MEDKDKDKGNHTPQLLVKGMEGKVLLGMEMELDMVVSPVDRGTIVGDDTKGVALLNMPVVKDTVVAVNKTITEAAGVAEDTMAVVNKGLAGEDRCKDRDRDRGTQVDKAMTKVVEGMAKVDILKVVKVNKVVSEICTIINLTDLLVVKGRGRGMGTIRCPLKVLLKGTTLRKFPPPPPSDLTDLPYPSGSRYSIPFSSSSVGVTSM